MARVLFVDDEKALQETVQKFLENDGHQVQVADEAQEAVRLLKENDFDVVISDIVMPRISGVELLGTIREISPFCKVIMVTGEPNVETAVEAVRRGAFDYLPKPFDRKQICKTVRTAARVKALEDENRRYKDELEEKVKERTRELAHTQDVTILGLATLAEYRDNETGGHIMRTQRYVRILADHLAYRDGFREYLDKRTIDLLFKSAPLHDIGKVAIRDNILLKPGRLTPEEFAEMEKHTRFGRDAISKAEKALDVGADDSFLSLAREIAYTHHEKWDGSGYPQGLKGEDIPLIGRLMAVADVYDALIGKRVYKPAFPHSKAVDIITEGDGRTVPEHFDPVVLKVFKETAEEFRQTALELADHEEERQALTE